MSEQRFKVCNVCHLKKPIEAFERNQYGKNNRIVLRPTCKECRSKKAKITHRQRKEFEKISPRPKVGTSFFCPICQRTFIREHRNDVALDHSHVTGRIRGWICGSCNTSIGKLNEDPEILKRAIEWIMKDRIRG